MRPTGLSPVKVAASAPALIGYVAAKLKRGLRRIDVLLEELREKKAA